MRRLTLLSGSKLHIASLCVWWAQPGIPQADVGPSEERAVGTAIHRCIQNYIGSGVAGVGAVITGLPEHDARTVANLYNAWCSEYSSQLGAQWCGIARCEVTYAFNAETRVVRELGANLERRYEEAGLLHEEIPVTVDLVVACEGRVEVYDWKTGAQRNRESILTHAQLRAGGFCAARVIGAASVTIVASYIDADGVSEERDDLSEFEFAAIEEELAALYLSVRRSPQPKPGAHCAELWCPAITSCPAVQRANEELARGESEPNTALVVPNAAAIRTKEQAAQMYTLLSQYDAFSEACWRALKAFVDAHGEVPLGDGRAYSAIEASRDTIRLSNESAAVVREMLGDKADEAIKMSITKESIKEATLALVGGGKKRTALERALMLRLEELGAVRVSTFTKYEVRKKSV